MKRASMVVVAAVVGLSSAHCATDACGCTPPRVPAVVVGRVVDGGGVAVASARVRAYSAPAPGCHAVGGELNAVTTLRDGSFRLPLASGVSSDSVCVLVFAHPPFNSNGLQYSDTALLVMDFRNEVVPDSAEVVLVLRVGVP
jgi:hypothetical protein